MKITKNQKIISVVSIGILIVSLALMFVDIFVSDFSFGYHPALTFLFCLFVGFGIVCLLLGLKNKSSFCFFLSAVLLGLDLFYIFLAFALKLWWAGLIVLAVFWAVMSILCFLSGSNKTEDIALNEKAEYKNYKQREAEKVKTEKEELPELKSFKE